MGIVVTIVMLLGLMAMLSSRVTALAWMQRKPNTRIIILLLIVLGIWNSLWHGLRHLDSFWGIAGLISGIFMLLTALLLSADKNGIQQSMVYPAYKAIKPISWLIVFGLLACFLLYAITLIQLNLGYPIIS
ncbi:MAG: hypothetical protein ACRBHB_17435 [Arenicella sp.]